MTRRQAVTAAGAALLVAGIGLLAPHTSASELASETSTTKQSTAKTVTMIDFGAGACIPCKLMAPILEDVRREYEGRATIVVIDVLREREKIAQYGIRMMPTQIFYDQSGNEAMRHEGFMDKRAIIAELEKLGVK